MTDFLSQPIIQTLGLTLLHFLWQGSIVGIVLFIVLCILCKPQTRYAVSCVALLALAILPIVTFTNLHETPSKIETSVQQNDVAVAPDVDDEGVSLEPAVTPPEQTTRNFVDKSRLTLYLPWIVMLWFIGALIFSCKLLFSFIALRRYKTKGVKLAEQTLQLKLLEFAKRLNVKQCITLLESKLVPVPVVLGWLRPVILLPTSAITGLSPQQLEMLLAHELAHVLRRDYLVNVLQSVLESLLFYHPVVWWVSAQIRKEREYCCDDIAVSLTGDSQHYAQTLLTLAEMRVQLAPSASGGQLFTRISRLLQPLETEMRPSYWFAGLSVLGVLAALALTVVNVSNAQEDKPQLWVTVVGDVTFNDDYSQITNMAPDTYIVIEERNGSEDKKVQVRVIKLNEKANIRLNGENIDSSLTIHDKIYKLSNGSVDIGDGKIITANQITVDTENRLLTVYNYIGNGNAKDSDDTAMAWYEQALENSIPHFYPRESKDPSMLGAEEYEDEVNGRTIYFIAEPTGFENTFMNVSTAQWETTPSQQELLDRYREDIRYQTQRYAAGLLKDRSFAGYLDGFTASPDFPTEIFPNALEAANEIKDVTLKQQLVTLIETRSKTPKEDQLLFVTTEFSVVELSGTITSKPSLDGKNRISGKITVNGEPASFANVSIGTTSDTAVDPGLHVAGTGSNKEGKFSLVGFDIPSGDYIIYVEHEDISLYNFKPFSIDKQELEINLDAVRNFKTLEPKAGATVSTTPTLSWESVPDAVRYVIAIHVNEIEEQFVYQITKATTLTLELPLESKKSYIWSVGAYDKSGRPINLSDFNKFSTE